MISENVQNDVVFFSEHSLVEDILNDVISLSRIIFNEEVGSQRSTTKLKDVEGGVRREGGGREEEGNKDGSKDILHQAKNFPPSSKNFPPSTENSLHSSLHSEFPSMEKIPSSPCSENFPRSSLCSELPSFHSEHPSSLRSSLRSDLRSENRLENILSGLEKLSDIINRYMDMPLLLYPYMGLLINDAFEMLKDFILLSNEIKDRIITSSNEDRNKLNIIIEYISYYIYTIDKCIGKSRIILYIPNDINLLYNIINTLEIIKLKTIDTFDIIIMKYEDKRWCLEYILLKWLLLLLINTPFKLNNIWSNHDKNVIPNVQSESSPPEVQSNSLPPAESSSPPEVTSNSSSTRRGASPNYLSLKGNATPGDRGGEGSDGSSIMGMMEDGAKDVLDVTSSGVPVADLREAEGEVIGRAVCKTKKDGEEGRDWTSSGKNGVKECYGDKKPHNDNKPHYVPVIQDEYMASSGKNGVVGNYRDKKHYNYNPPHYELGIQVDEDKYVTSSGSVLPGSDLWELEGEINREGCLQDDLRWRATMASGEDLDWTSVGTASGITLYDYIMCVCVYYLNKSIKLSNISSNIISCLYLREDAINLFNIRFGLLLKQFYNNDNNNNNLYIGLLLILKNILKKSNTDNILPFINIILNILINNISSNNINILKIICNCLGKLGYHLLLLNDDNNNNINIIINLLLNNLIHYDIRIRCICSKSINIITNKLSIELNEQILLYIINNIYKYYINNNNTFILKSEYIIHGYCLAIAEIIKNKLICPKLLYNIINCTCKTITFDIYKSKKSSSTIVKDASCYISWIIARHYNNYIIDNNKSIIKLCKHLINITIFDNSINCKRAANAALQEIIGRFNNIPYGLNVIVIANYYTITNRKHSYIHITNQLAKLKYYNQSMLKYLIQFKLYHPDIITRELTAIAITNILINDITPEVTSTSRSLAESSPPEVNPAVSSSNYLSLKSKATPGDRGDVKDGSSIMGMMEDGSKDVLDVTSSGSGKPGSDLRELEGEVNREGCLQDEGEVGDEGSGLPVSDLRELEGEVIGRAVCKTKKMEVRKWARPRVEKMG